MKTSCAVFGLVVLLGFYSLANADTDGYFCIGPDYLAYELVEPNNLDAHTFFLIPFINGSSSISKYEIELPTFQVHDMHCDENQVQLFGWDSIFEVRWAAKDPSKLSYAETKKDPGPTNHSGEQIYSLVYGPAKTIELVEPGASVWYLLEIKRADIAELPCTMIATAKLTKIRSPGPTVSIGLVGRDIPKDCGE